MKPAYAINEYGQPLHPTEFYDPIIPGWIEQQCLANELVSACYEAFDEYCEKLTFGNYDPEYDEVPGFDDFKDEWFQNYAQNMIEAEDVDDGAYDGQYWRDFRTALAKALQKDETVTAKGFMPYFNQWYKHGFYKAA